MTDLEFSNQLQTLLAAKQEWYNTTELPKLLDQYRLLYTCVNNLYEVLTQKSLITADPYRLDKKISDITAPDNDPFPDTEKSLILGTRLSDYITMLDFVCTYTRFTVENISLPKIKKLTELNNSFLWNELSPNSAKPNTKSMSELLAEAKVRSPALVVSLLNDNVSKAGQTLIEINSYLAKLTQFQREIYKGIIRKDVFEHSSFNREKAYSSQEAELAEIKRLYPLVLGKKPFYTELINEIILEDQSPDKEKIRTTLFEKLQITETAAKRKKKVINPKDLLLNSLNTLGALAPIYQAISVKISDNFELMNEAPKSVIAKLIAALKKSFNSTPKEIEYTVPVTDPVTKTKTNKKIKSNTLLFDLRKKQRIYYDISSKGSDYTKILNATDQVILSYVEKQIVENQNMFSLFLSLDEFFKNSTPAANKPKVKGLKIDLDSMKNTIINVNKKKGEYQSFIEEAEQMKKLGISND